MSGTFAEQADAYAAQLTRAVARLAVLERAKAEAEAAWCERGGSVRMWNARNAVDHQHRLIVRLRKEVETHRMLADLVAGVRR